MLDSLNMISFPARFLVPTFAGRLAIEIENQGKNEHNWQVAAGEGRVAANRKGSRMRVCVVNFSWHGAWFCAVALRAGSRRHRCRGSALRRALPGVPWRKAA